MHTDDTASMLVLAEHLATHRDGAMPVEEPVEEVVHVEEFARAWRAEP